MKNTATFISIPKSKGQKIKFKKIIMGPEIYATVIVFFAVYHIIKLVSEHLLKRKLIKAEQYDKPGILEPIKVSDENNKYPSLKWGLVALMTGLGFILIEVMRQVNPELIDYHDAVLPIGILLVFVSLGFLIYFFIVNGKRNKE